MRVWAAIAAVALCGVSGDRGAARDADLGRFFAGHEGAFVLLDARNLRYVRHNPERCRQRFVPASTFKIPNALIGLETSVIPNPDHLFRWDGTKHPIPTHNRDHTLRSAFTESAGWYYQKLAAGVGTERMRRHVAAFRYGNREVDDASTRFWHRSLKISADEHVAFLLRLYRNELPLSRRAMEQVREMMVAARTEQGVLRGKTGTDGYEKDGELFATLGWYVGWLERGGDAWIFAGNISGGENPVGRRVRLITEEILKSRGLW